MARERGQASVELVAVVPLVALAGAVAVQVGVAAHAWGAAREAARAGARAVQVDAPARDAARRMLGGALSDGSRVRVIEARDGSRRVSVSVAVPMLVPWVSEPSVSADARVPG